MSAAGNCKVVISGISGSFPDSHNVKEFGENLNAKILLCTNDGRRWELIHPEICNYTGKIYDLEKFDPGFFGVHARQNNTMDVNTRLFLEKSVEAIFDAGVNPKELAGTKTGVFIGVCSDGSDQTWFVKNCEPKCNTALGCLRCIIPNRVSYYLKLQGPSHTTDTACSSSLFALEHAVCAIRSGECDKAIVGGCNMCLHPYISLQFARLGVLNPDGKCKTFDAAADGYTRSEANVAIFIQKAEDAKRVYCEIVHAKSNCDGYKEEGITFPSAEAQTNLMQEFYRECNISPSDLSYVEAHGTGTMAGDPQELEAISRTFLDGRKTPLMIGSVKSNMGHSEPASGVVSVAKVIIAMESGIIPPNINYFNPRKGVTALEKGLMKVVTEPTPFEDNRGLVGVNSFGFGGGNCHTLLRWNEKVKVNGGRPKDDLPRLVCISGRSKEAINFICDDIKSRPLDAEHVGLFHEIFKINLDEHYYRGFSVVSKTGELSRSVQFSDHKPIPKYLVFSDFGPQWIDIFNDLKDLETFKTSLNNIEKAASKVGLVLGQSLKINNSESEVLGSTVLQLAVVDTLKNLNLTFDRIFSNGQNGEIACHYYDGSLSLEDSLSIFSKNNRKLPQSHKLDDTIKNSYKAVVFSIGKVPIEGAEERVVLTFESLQTFLECIGKLYEFGQSPTVSKLYPAVQFPVSRGTPMISHLIKWDHSASWTVTLYKSVESFSNKSSENSTIGLDLESEQFQYVKGHVIDGRTLFPATGYLYLVWENFAQNHGMMIGDVPVVFENVRFVRAINLTNTSKVPKIAIMVQKGSGLFEITQDDGLIVSGRVRFPTSDKELDFMDFPEDEDTSNNALDLSARDVYKELRLRGYNYKDLFKSVVHCNGAITRAKVSWRQNWVAFLDNMLQVKILQEDTRLLYVPTEIRHFVINPKKHMEYVTEHGENPDIPILINKRFGVIRSDAIQISGMGATSIPRRKATADPLIEKYQFVPNVATLSLSDSAKVNSQLLLENLPELKVRVVELIDEATGQDVEPLSPLIQDVLTNLPLMQPESIILTKRGDLQVANVTVSNKTLSSEIDCSLIVISAGLQRLSVLRQAFSILKPRGLVISREDLTTPLNKDPQIDILTVHTTSTERLVLIRQKAQSEVTPTVIDLSTKHFAWVSDLQNLINKNKAVLLVSQDSNSGIVGLVNCLRREKNGENIQCVFVHDKGPKFDPKLPFYADQVKLGLAFNVFKDGQWGSYRHLDLDAPVVVERDHSYLATLDRGDLTTLTWVEGPLKNNDRLEGSWDLVHVYYSSLNFRDVMSATGRITVDVFVKERLLQENIQGLEFSGRTSSGKRVMGAVIGGAMSTLVAADVHFMTEVPDNWSLQEAATVPTVYCTVIYAFFIRTQIKKGDKILIHAGTGGIGLSAITLALFYGCEVFTTVSSQEKRDFLKKEFPALRDDHIGNSRDISFEQLVMDHTNGRGVDYVLNSLAEEKLDASVRCLARGGRFLEIGKFDIGNNKALQLLFLKKDASFHGIMLDNIVLGDKVLKAHLMGILFENIAKGAIRPLPRTIFKEDQAEQAFRHMTTGKHIGKVLLEMRVEENDKKAIPLARTMKTLPKYWCNPKKSYVIAGGLGGFGMELADWLVVRGARKLVLTSRRGISTGYHTYRMNIWKSYGVQVEVFTDDITSKSGCETILKKASSLGPIEAIFNLAVVLKDAAFENQTPESFEESAKPKADATQHLDELSRRLCPDLRSFVVFSSVSCGRGNFGQTNYGMSNSVMERICERRRSEGLPGLAIQWGAIGEVGLVAEMQEENVEIEIGGTLQQRINNCLEILDRLLNQPNAIVSSMVVSENRKAYTAADNVLDAVAGIIGIKDLKTVSHHVTLPELGMDSMSGVELKQTLERDFDIVLTPQDLRSMTLDKLKQLEEARIIDAPKENGVQDVELAVDEILEKFTNDEDTARLSFLNFETKAPANEDRRIVFFPGIEGVIKILNPLIENLNFQASCIQYDLKDPPKSIGDIARRALPIVKKLTKNKEYRIVGYSFGGVVALEVASLLEAEGYTGTLVCLDGTPLVIAGTAMKMFDFTSEAHLQTGLLFHLYNTFFNTAISSSTQAQIFQCKNLDERVELSMKILANDPPASTIEYMKAVCNASYHRFKALEDYQPNYKKVKSGVKLYKASELMDSSAPEDYGITKLCENLQSVEQFEGTHTTVLQNIKLVQRINEDFANKL